jgi:hypothetical protein
MGVVYRARQTALNRVVALKMILYADHAGASGRQRFRTEAEAVARLQHPHIVQIHEVGEAHGLPYFSLEFCPGGSLADKLKEAPLAPAEAARLVEQLARAMEAAHQKGVVHRDLKPANVLLAEDGSPRISDFGLARLLDAAGHTATGALLGTPSYMAPEQAGQGKEVGPAADVYALGAILYECLTGRPPFKAATLHETLYQVLSAEPAPPTQLQAKMPRDLETICLKCLRKEPGRRYAGAAALADDLGRWREGRPIAARPAGPAERAWRWCRRNPAVAVLAAAVFVLLTTGTAIASTFAVQASQAAARAEAAVRERDQARLRIRDITLRLVKYMKADPTRVALPARELLGRFLKANPDISPQELDAVFVPDLPLSPPRLTLGEPAAPARGGEAAALSAPNMIGD